MKKLFCLALALLLCLGLAACGAVGFSGAEPAADGRTKSYEGINYRYDADSALSTPEASAAGTGQSGSDAASTAQKLIRRVSLTVETEHYDVFMDGLSAAVTGLGGYFEKIEAYTSGKEPSASLVIRVPANRLDELLSHVDGAGNVTYRTESQTDVTLDYVDTESRNKALKVEQDRLLELLEQAKDLDQILSIEDRLTNVRYQIEKTEASLRAMDNLVDYATVTLSLRQVEVYTPVEETDFWANIGSGFVSSAKNVWNVLKDLFSGLVIYLPYLLLFPGIPILVIAILVSRRRKKAKARRKATQNPQPVPPTQESNRN